VYNKQTWEMMPDRAMNPHEFYRWVQSQTRKHNVITRLTRSDIVKYKDPDTNEKHEVCGWFSEPVDDDPGRIMVAYGHGEIEWLGTMAHEYVHFLQWLAWGEKTWNDPIWEHDDMIIELECQTEKHAALILESAGLLHSNMVRNSEVYCKMMHDHDEFFDEPSDFNAEEGWWLNNANV